MSASHAPEVVVSALTYNRPEGLARLVEGLARVTGAEHCVFLVVDNSPNGGARALVESSPAHDAIDLRYVHEPKPGISAGRNRALAEAIKLDARFLAFIDDDEWPEPAWLYALRATQSATAAAAVVGPVQGQLPPDAPAWMSRGDFFTFEGLQEAQELKNGATNNVLIDLDLIARLDLQFDDAFGLSGGEDTLFFTSLRRRGGRIVFARLALVHEAVSPERAKLPWLFNRWVRGGNIQARVDMKLDRQPRWLAGAHGMARLGAGALLSLVAAPAALLGRFDLLASALRIVAHGAGRLSAAFGTVVSGYARPRPAAHSSTSPNARERA